MILDTNSMNLTCKNNVEEREEEDIREGFDAVI